MIFTRSAPRRYVDYRDYRPHLRHDFQHLCAYCLRHEYHMGGEANAQIDHRCPVSICPDRETDYTNLYLSCAECNGVKRETWPSATQQAHGFRFLDPCAEDHDSHWEVMPDGRLRALTPVGEYTIDKIALDRASLNHFRRRMLQVREKVESIRRQLAAPELTPEEKREFENRLGEYEEFLHPPIFPKAVFRKTPDM